MEATKIMYGLLGLLLTSDLLTYLTGNTSSTSINEFLKERKQPKKRQPKPEFPLLDSQDK